MDGAEPLSDRCATLTIRHWPRSSKRENRDWEKNAAFGTQQSARNDDISFDVDTKFTALARAPELAAG